METTGTPSAVKELKAVTETVKSLIHGKASRNGNGERLNSIMVSRGTLTALYTMLAVCSAELETGRELVDRN